MKSTNKAFIYGIVAILSWSTVATSFKVALSYYSHFEMLLVAAITAFLLLAVAMTVQRKWPLLLKPDMKQWTKYALIGLLNPVAYYLVLFKAYDLLPAQVAQPINYSWPIVLLILMAVIVRKAIPGIKYIGMFLSLLGVVIISWGSGNMEEGNTLPLSGLLLALLSAILWASFWIVNRTNEQTDNTVSLFLSFFFGSVYLVLLSFFIGIDLSSSKGLLASIYVGTFEMAIPFIFFGLALRGTNNPVLINQLCYLSPFISLFIIHFVLGENIYPSTYIGMTLIVLGIVFNEYIVQRIKKTT